METAGKKTGCRSWFTSIAVGVSLVVALLFGINPGQALAAQVTLAWDANTESDVAGYKLYYRTAGASYGVPINVGNATTSTITTLADGRTYYFAVTAFDTVGNESGFSNEVAYTTPVAGTAAAEIELAGNATNIIDGDTTPAAADFTDFGSAAIVGGAVSRTFTIRNSGAGSLNLSGRPPVAVSGSNAADFKVAVQPVSPVTAAGSTTFEVRFDPWAAGVRVATISILNSDTDENPFTFAVRGTGTSPEIELYGNAVSIFDGDSVPSAADHTDFGGTSVTGGAVTRTFTIHNLGSGDLTLDGSPLVAIGGMNAADFTVTALPLSSVPAGGSTTFQVRFDPSAGGKRYAHLSIVSNDANEKIYNFALRGTGTAPEISLTGNWSNIVDGDTSPAAADRTDFGIADIAAGSITRTFSIRNTGSEALTFSGSQPVAISGLNAADFSVAAQPPASVAPGASATFQVTFDPRALGTRVATVTIPNNDPDESPFDFAIRGTGANAPEINVTGNGAIIAAGGAAPTAADHTDFGSTTTAQGAIVRTFTIQNTGTKELLLIPPRVWIGGAHATDFKVIVQPPASIAPAASATFDVRFDPNAAGVRVATIAIESNDSDEKRYSFKVQGTGTVAPEISLIGNALNIVDGDTSPATTDFTDFGGVDVRVGAVTRGFTIRNVGSAVLTLSGTPRVAVGGANAADFTVPTQPSDSLWAGGSRYFQVRFDPSAAGLRVATITIASNDADENPYTFAIQGTGTGTTAAAAAADAEPAAATTGAETISKPTSPAGPAGLLAGATYTFSTNGAVSSKGDAVQYRFSWSDGTTSGWLPPGVVEATKSWAAAGTYTQVQVQARCANHPSIVSPLSAPRTVTVGAAVATETVTRPGKAVGASSLPALASSVYRTGGAVSSSGDALQYRFLWSDGTMTDWLPVGVLQASKSWSAPGSYEVRTEARCALHPSAVSSAAPPLLVSVSPGIDELLAEPALPLGPGQGETGFLYAFEAGGASSSAGHPVQYRFQWGDGTTSSWVTAGDSAQVRAWKLWPAEGTYSVTSEARCSEHPELTISSAAIEVQIVPGDPEIFFDDFSISANVGDTPWQVVSGEWVVNPDGTFAPASPNLESLAIVGTLPEMTTGRLTAGLKLAAGSTNYTAGIIFDYRDGEHYRYLVLTDSSLDLGQVGDTAVETGGVKASVDRAVEQGMWHQLRVDVQSDGEIRAYFGQSELPDLTYRFGDPVLGRVGLAANTSAVSLDDFGVWDERVLLP